MRELVLTANWQLKAHDARQPLAEAFSSPDGWLPATVPGSVHQDLLTAGAIPDPFIGLNELDVQWIGERDWLYRGTFDLPAALLGEDEVTLCFDGLDTYATVWLNGQQILQSENMFVPARVAVKEQLRGGSNELRIHFASALKRGQALEAEQGKMTVWNGDPSRVYVRKAQYHYGWDWGPTLLTAGPWRAIRLEAYSTRIADLHSPIEVSADLQEAKIPIQVTLEGNYAELAVQLSLYGPDGVVIATATVVPTANHVDHTFIIRQPALWWPAGHGLQPLYRVEAALVADDAQLDQRAIRIGLRRLALVQEPLADAAGSTFYFAINNRPIFCGGANWIPADSFTPRISEEKYRTLLQMAADANMAMIRVWGGGIYEEDCFYDICDELGLLVWQDFLFACGLYPAPDWFQTSVRAEAEANVQRLRNHPSLVIWCGNNEDYQLAHSIKAYDPTVTTDLANSAFPARAIYEGVLPEVCAALDPTRPYWPGSPYLGDNPSDPTQGDRHTWDIWHGRMAPYQEYASYGARFVSEFGMQAYPHRATIDAFAPPEERFPASRTLEHHNKAEGGVRRIAAYLADNLRTPADLDGMIYATQLIQAEAMAAAIRGWRRNFGGPGHYAMAGALIWQLNDCWPVTSWALVDYALRPKAAYYAVKRALAPLVVELAKRANGADLWVVSQLAAPVTATIHIDMWTLDGERLARIERILQIVPHQATSLAPFTYDVPETVVLGAQLLVDGVVISRNALWPEPLKYLPLADSALTLTRSGEEIRLSTVRPVKGMWLDGGDGVRWSDNLLDLMPDEEIVLTAQGLGDKEIQVRWLGQDW